MLAPQSQSANSLTHLLTGSPAEWAAATPLQPVDFEPLRSLGLTVWCKREDQLHPQASGNKLYKLSGHLQQARARGARTLISFGGYYSNHLHALASLGGISGFQLRGVVRGQRPPILSPTLRDCERHGMALEFVSRKDYRLLQTEAGMQQLASRYPDAYIIAEGGGGSAGLAGCGAMLDAIRQQLDLRQSSVCVPCGTGTTLAGLLAASRPGERLLGFSALKLGAALADYRQQIEGQAGEGAERASWDLLDDQLCGGFARFPAALLDFMDTFEAETGIALDPVYTGKMVYTAVHLARQGYWPVGHQLVLIHTGGLQGRRGLSRPVPQETS